MDAEIVRRLAPEEEEVARKREELIAIRAALAERELELTDLRAQLRSFEGHYLREVGTLYAELDEWEAKIAELEASLRPSTAASERAAEARRQAEETHEATHGEASKAWDFQPPAELKSLFRDVAKRIHPDFAKDDADRDRRTRIMAQANEAYSQGDAESLQRILDEYHEGSESVQGEGIGAELVRIIRQIHQAKKNIAVIEQEIASLRASEIAKLKQEVEAVQQEGRDLLAELKTDVYERIADARKKHKTLAVELKNHGQ
jgi:predicted  nucleic acid-binding Zn-ribbon protein